MQAQGGVSAVAAFSLRCQDGAAVLGGFSCGALFSVLFAVRGAWYLRNMPRERVPLIVQKCGGSLVGSADRIGGEDLDPSRVSIARGLAYIALISSVVVLVKAVLPYGTAAASDYADCDVAVAVVEGEGGRQRLGCATDPVLDGCATASAGDKLILNSERCDVIKGGMGAAMRLVAGVPIDLNRATVADLELLDGIGPKLAAEIIRDRNDLGPFNSVDDVDRVKGIGPSKLEKMRPYITVSSEM